jgi:hypothetical protein
VVSTAWASVDAVVDATDKRIHMSDVFLTAIRAYNDDLLAAIGAYFTRGESVFVAPHFCHSRRCGCQVIDSGNNFHATAYRASEGSVFDAFDQRDDTGCVLRMTVRAHNNHLFGAVAADFVGTNRVLGTPHSSNFRVLGSQIVDSKNKLFAVMCFCFGCNSSLIDFDFFESASRAGGFAALCKFNEVCFCGCILATAIRANGDDFFVHVRVIHDSLRVLLLMLSPQRRVRFCKIKKTASKEDCPCKSGMLKMKSEMVSLIHYLSYAVRKCRQLQLARNVTRVQVAKKCCYTACEFILQRTKTHDIAYKTKNRPPREGWTANRS